MPRTKEGFCLGTHIVEGGGPDRQDHEHDDHQQHTPEPVHAGKHSQHLGGIFLSSVFTGRNKTFKIKSDRCDVQ